MSSNWPSLPLIWISCIPSGQSRPLARIHPNSTVTHWPGSEPRFRLCGARSVPVGFRCSVFWGNWDPLHSEWSLLACTGTHSTPTGKHLTSNLSEWTFSWYPLDSKWDPLQSNLPSCHRNGTCSILTGTRWNSTGPSSRSRAYAFRNQGGFPSKQSNLWHNKAVE